MKAGVATANGLEVRDIPRPEPKPFEILVKVKAAGLNRADLAAARGSGGHGTVGATVGIDWAGEVVSEPASTTSPAQSRPAPRRKAASSRATA